MRKVYRVSICVLKSLCRMYLDVKVGFLVLAKLVVDTRIARR